MFFNSVAEIVGQLRGLVVDRSSEQTGFGFSEGTRNCNAVVFNLLNRFTIFEELTNEVQQMGINFHNCSLPFETHEGSDAAEGRDTDVNTQAEKTCVSDVCTVRGDEEIDRKQRET
jgi:hypothetical protein